MDMAAKTISENLNCVGEHCESNNPNLSSLYSLNT